MKDKQPLTTRRGFIATLGFGAVSLYGLWVGYGAAPSPLALLRSSSSGGHDAGGHGAPAAEEGAHDAKAEPVAEAEGHGGHGAASDDVDAFRKQAEEFAERYRMPDGSVYPRLLTAAPEVALDHSAHGAHGGMDMAASQDESVNEPVDVYLMAYQWGYTSDLLRLDAGKPYRFRMMAADVTHGASIQLGRASRIIRLRPGAITEQTLTFKQPGEYLIYCTVYCGMAHDAMKARIVVV